MNAHRTILDVDTSMPETPFARPGGSLLVLAGLPGTGKSMIVDHLIKLTPAAVIRTDHVRLLLRETPTYTAAEMMLIYEVCHMVIDLRLSRGQRVIFDGTNHMASRRHQLFNIAKKNDAVLAVCQIQASEAVIRQRLLGRKNGKRRATDLSDAGWSVYQWMVEAQEPIVHEHLILDTTLSPSEELAIKLNDYWMRIEREWITSNSEFQT